MSRGLVIAIDGPAGSGKSTVARLLARRLGLELIETGAMYRAVALGVLEYGAASDVLTRAGEIASGLDIELRWEPDSEQSRVWLNGREVTAELRRPEVAEWSSRVAAVPAVRTALLEIQRTRARAGGVVMEGRDIGTVVLPAADFKFFLDADLEERVRRRADDGRGAGEGADALAARDQRDAQRAVAPLKAAADAIIVDTTNMALADVVAKLLAHIRPAAADVT